MAISLTIALATILGLFIGNLLRQLIPWVRLLYTKTSITWDATYTRRLIYSVIISLMYAAITFNSNLFVPITNDMTLSFFTAASFAININWLTEEMAQWEYAIGGNATPAGTP